MVYNLPARYALDFLDENSGKSGRGKYLNRYDVARIVGTPLSGDSIRERIDKALKKVSSRHGGNLTATDGYYGAMELNGTGIRYFGDICLVLHPERIDQDTLTLIRNSYDLCVEPVSAKLQNLPPMQQDNEAADILQSWSGKWGPDGVSIATVKVMKHAVPTIRRMTTGHVSDGVLSDEDYVEVVRKGSFEPSNLEEIRLTANDAALEAQIADRVHVGNTPPAAHMLWRFRRRRVDQRAREGRLPVRTVTTTGRARS